MVNVHWIVLVEPSIFRRDESYVLGPFSRLRARWEGIKIVWCNPHAEARIVPAECVVVAGDRRVWPR